LSVRLACCSRGVLLSHRYNRKHAIETTETLDFLKEIVETVPDPSAGGTIDIESEIAEAAKKKRGKGKKAGATGEQPTKKRRKKQGEAVEAEAEGSGEGDGEMKSEADGDVVMHEDEGIRREKNGKAGYRPRSPGSEDEDGSEDRPFMPRR
jgi:Dr1-associated corepressor